MCGIVYSKNFTGKPVARTIKKRYKGQRSRGFEGFGFYVPETNRLTHNPRERRTMRLLKRERASEILFHHRYPTSTINVRNACHPFSTKDYFEHNYVGVHNGVLWNEDILRQLHKEKGIKYVSDLKDGSFNDSEALIYDIASYLEGTQEYIRAVGSIAFIVIQRDKLGKPLNLFFGRNEGSPLVMSRTEKQMTISSVGSGEIVPPHTLHQFNYASGELTTKPCFIMSGYSSKNACGYSGYSGYSENDYLELEKEFMTEYSNSSKDNSHYGRWLYECDYDTEGAIYLAEYEIGEKEKYSLQLSDKVEVFGNASDRELDEYNTIDYEIDEMKKDLEKLREEFSGYRQMGFRTF